MSSNFFTNEGANSLLNKFAGVFAANKDIARFDALVGHLRSSGYFLVRPHLENGPKIRILVGINVDEIVESYLFLPDGFSEHQPGAVITGSSNLTDAGLGTKDRASNYTQRHMFLRIMMDD